MVVATADRKIVVVNLDQPSVAFNTITSPLKYHSPAAPPPSARSSSEPLRMIQRYQSRCIAAFPDQRGFCLGSIAASAASRWSLGGISAISPLHLGIGSIEGRVAVHHVNKVRDPDAAQMPPRCRPEGAEREASLMSLPRQSPANLPPISRQSLSRQSLPPISRQSPANLPPISRQSPARRTSRRISPSSATARTTSTSTRSTASPSTLPSAPSPPPALTAPPSLRDTGSRLSQVLTRPSSSTHKARSTFGTRTRGSGSRPSTKGSLCPSPSESVSEVSRKCLGLHQGLAAHPRRPLLARRRHLCVRRLIRLVKGASSSLLTADS